MRLLVTAIGKRVQLIKHLRKHFEVIGIDCSELVPARFFVSSFYQTVRFSEDSYIDKLLDICQKEKVNIILPLYEQEFILLDAYRKQLKAIGTFLMLSNKTVLATCNDKWATYKFFLDNDINTPKSYISLEEGYNFPLFIKPRTGMGSQQAFKANNTEELYFYFNRIKNPIVQEFVEGKEYTIDCICGMDGRPVSVVPRERLEVRAGEVSKSRTCKDAAIIDAAVDVCEKLGAIGPITIQCIKTAQGDIKFIEINPRVGGGVPLTFEAGVDYGTILKKMAMGEKVEPLIGQFKEITMLRYDEAVFI
ncbi:ATP-grasp domain-containing protein [Petroclostridium xylanilyticum]|uniref:ATP-grasp domain-containing protein n=1 Tax=Petroclostridium xylanilyticum TaxID=1792311 RepID=UPI000B994156|nr:ATP-grasp domain-containing protein [Petroclostridium xylanilyticum]